MWLSVGIKHLRDYIIKKRLSSSDAFERFLLLLNLKEQGKINKHNFRSVMKREGLPFNVPQCDFLFKHLDSNNDGYLDLEEWTHKI